MPFLPPSQQRQSTVDVADNKLLQFSQQHQAAFLLASTQ